MTQAHIAGTATRHQGASGTVPLVLLPGTLCDARLFEPLLARLDLDGRTVVHAEYRGARSVAAAIAHLLAVLPPRFVLLGFSLGGIVALALARTAPERVAGLILVGTTACPVDPALHGSRREDVARARAQGLDVVLATSLMPRYLADATDRRHDALFLAMATDVDRFDDETALALSRDDARAWLGELAMPVLIAGGAQDAVNPPAVQQAMASVIPDAQLVLLAGAGHFTPLEQPEALACHIAAWLAQTEAYEFQPTKEEQR